MCIRDSSNSLQGYGAYIVGDRFELIKLKAQANINTDSDIDDKNIYYANVSKDFLLLTTNREVILYSLSFEITS